METKALLIAHLSLFFKNFFLTPSPLSFVLGLSGGADSVALFHLLRFLQKKYSFHIIAAHLDHEWYPEEKKDLSFCQSLCHHYSIPFITMKASELQTQLSSYKKAVRSQEAQGRFLRRYFLEYVADTHNASYILLAHHADDQRETALIRALRGAGLRGLGGMKEKEGKYLRPFLSINKKTILTFLKEEHYAYCFDICNTKDHFLRNRIRKYVIPALKKADPRAETTLLNTIIQLQQAQAFIDRTIETSLDHITFRSSAYSLPLWKQLDPYIQSEILIHILIAAQVPFTPSTGLLEELRRFLHKPAGGCHQFSKTHALRKRGKVFWIECIV